MAHLSGGHFGPQFAADYLIPNAFDLSGYCSLSEYAKTAKRSVLDTTPIGLRPSSTTMTR